MARKRQIVDWSDIVPDTAGLDDDPIFEWLKRGWVSPYHALQRCKPENVPKITVWIYKNAAQKTKS